MKSRRKLRKSLLIAGLLMVILSISYTIAYARELRCHFVAWSDLKAINTYLYVDPRMSKDQITQIEGMLSEAQRRDRQFYGDVVSAPVIIAGPDEKVIEKFGSNGNRTAVTHLYFGEASIVLGPDGLDTSVIAHEMMHAELSERIGWLTKEMNIPTWFDEGLAMQADYREDYSEAAWQKESEGGRLAPALNTIVSQSAFNSENYWINYATSKHEVGRWYGIVGTEGLHKLLNRVRRGEEFEDVYRSAEREYATGRER